MVERASGKRRVRKSVDDWRYVLEMAEGWRDEVEEDSEETEEARRFDGKDCDAGSVALGVVAV